MEIREHMENWRTRSALHAAATKERKHAPNKTYSAASAERFSDYILSLDGTDGGYIYGEDWSGDDLQALCDIFGA